jgi:hypothetical protein
MELLDPNHVVQLGSSQKMSKQESMRSMIDSPLLAVRRQSSLLKKNSSFKEDETESEDRDYLCKNESGKPYPRYNFELPNEQEVNLLMKISENLRHTIDS